MLMFNKKNMPEKAIVYVSCLLINVAININFYIDRVISMKIRIICMHSHRHNLMT